MRKSADDLRPQLERLTALAESLDERLARLEGCTSRQGNHLVRFGDQLSRLEETQSRQAAGLSEVIGQLNRVAAMLVRQADRLSAQRLSQEARLRADADDDSDEDGNPGHPLPWPRGARTQAEGGAGGFYPIAPPRSERARRLAPVRRSAARGEGAERPGAELAERAGERPIEGGELRRDRRKLSKLQDEVRRLSALFEQLEEEDKPGHSR